MALENTPPVPDTPAPQPTDNQDVSPLGVLYPEGLQPLQGLANPGLTVTPDLTGGYIGGGTQMDPYDALKNNSLSSYSSKVFDPANITQPLKYSDESFTKLQKTFDNQDRDFLFRQVGFYPYENNEDRFARNLTRWQKAGLAWDNMTSLAGETFKEYWVTEGKFWGNLVTGDIKDAFLPFNEKQELENMGRLMQDITTQNYIPLTLAEQRGEEFGFGKFATALGQFGFTLGTMMGFSTQLGLELAAAALLTPETGGASIAVEGVSIANKARKLLTLAKFYKNLSKVENGAENANRIRKAFDYLTNTKNLKAGFGDFYSFTKQWNAAAGEAKFEAASSYVDYIDGENRKARNEGRTLSLGERSVIEDDATKIATGNGITNTGLLFIMNRINMGNLFRGPFGAQRRFISELSGIPANMLVKTAKGWVEKGAVGMFTKEGALGAAKGLGKWSVNSAWEGVQEVVQGASAEYWDKFYKDQYDRKSGYDQMYLAGKTMSDHLDGKNSFDEFISGFIIGAPGSAINMSVGKILDSTVYKDKLAQQKKVLSDYASKLNKWEENPLRVFDPRLSNTNNQMEYARQMNDAVKSGDIYAYKNLHNQHMRDMVMLGIRTGKLEYMIDTMKDQLTNLNDDEFEAIFKVTADSTNRKSAMDYLNTFEKKSSEVVKDYDKIKQNFPNPFSNVTGLKEGSDEKRKADIRYVAWENAVQDLIFEKDTYKNVLERMQGILGDVKDSLGSALYNPFYTSTSDTNITTETLLLEDELKNLKAAEVQDESTRALISKKERQLAALKKWRDSNKLITESFTRAEGFSLSMAEFTDESKAAFKELLDAYQDLEGGDPITSEQLEAGYKGVIDYARLNNDKSRAVTNISLLSSPEGFTEQFERHNEAANKFYIAEMLRRQAVVQLRKEVLNMLESNDPFVQQPKIKVLYARLKEAASHREFDRVDELFDAIIEEYKQFYQIEEGKVEEIISDDDYKNFVDNNVVLDDILNSIADKVMSQQPLSERETAIFTGKTSEINEIIKQKAGAQPAAQPVATPPVTQPPTPAGESAPTATVDVNDLLEKINNATVDQLLEDYADYLMPGTAKYDLLTDEERARVDVAISNRARQLQGLPKKAYEDTDPEFKSAYNAVRQRIRDILKNKNVPISVISKAFDEFNPVLDSLADNIKRAEWKMKIDAEKETILRTLKRNEDSKNLATLKTKISQAIKNLQLLSDMDEAAMTIIGEQASPEVKEELIKYYVSLIDKRYEDAINKLSQEGSAENDNIVLKYINDLNNYRKKIQGALDIFMKKSEELGDQMGDINLAVDIDTNYQNDVHVSITEGEYNYTRKATMGQIIALSNMLRSGTLSVDDKFNLESPGSVADASYIINIGVARIHTININKTAYIFIKTGDTAKLKTEITDYLMSAKGNESSEYIKNKADNIINDLKSKYDQDKDSLKVTDILDMVGIPKTAEITDEQYKLLRNYKYTISSIQSEGNLLAELDELANKKEKFLDGSTIYSNIEQVIPIKNVQNIVKKFIKREKGQKADVIPYYNDLLDVVEQIRVITSMTEADALVKTLARKHAPPASSPDLINISKALIATVLEVEAVMFNNQTAPELLTDEEIVRILNGEERTLTSTQLEQVKQYKNDLIEASRGKLSRSPGYQEIVPELGLEELTIVQSGKAPGMLALRPKDDADVRTEQDLADEYKVTEGKINTRLALQNIINSDFATLGEKELARKLLGRTSVDDVIMVDNAMAASGEFDPETNNVSINLKGVSYTDESPNNPIETVILHELLHREIETELQNPTGEFTKAIRSAMAAVRNNNNAKTFYAFQDNLTDDEQIREFVIEAFTNPSFQHLLASVSYAKSGKSVWEKFLDILSNFLKKIGIDVEGTVLNEVINQTTELIKSNYTNDLLPKVSQAATIEELNTLSEDLSYQEDAMIPSLYASAQKLISSKIDSIKAKQMADQLKGMSSIKIGKTTYYYDTKTGVLRVSKKTRKGVVPVKSAEVYEQVFTQLLKTNSLSLLISDSMVKTLKSIMGEPGTVGAYANGDIYEGLTLGETTYSPFAGTVISLPFKSDKEYADFKNEFWSFQKTGKLTQKNSYLKDKYGATAVMNYGELATIIGSRKDIEKLVKRGVIAIKRNGPTLEEITYNLSEQGLSESQFYDYLEFLKNGGNINSTEYQETRKYINDIIKQALGVNISENLQTKIENEVLKITDEEETTTEDKDVPTQEGDVTYTPPVHKAGADPADFDATLVTPFEGISAMETYALRSLSYDIFPNNGQETPEFTEYYSKVRKIVNALHLKDTEQLKDIFVTIHADNAGLRWDGSVTEDWMKAKKGVIGFLSDINGNPIVFSSTGERVGTLDRNNLSDKKDLDNGENQIVYFKLFAEDSKSPMAQLLTKESYDKLKEARRKAAAGTPQIANITMISAGQMNKRKLAKYSQANRKNTAVNPEFLAQIMQPNISFKFNNKGVLMMVIADKDGAVNEEPLYPPNTRYVKFNKNGVETPFIDYIIDVMKAYHEMSLRNDPNALVVKENLIKFVYNIWLTGQTLKIPNSLSRFSFKVKGSDEFEIYDVLKIVNNEVVINQDAFAEVANKLGNRPINISKKWWNKESGFEDFLFPVITEKDGVRTVQFRNIDFKNFIMTKVGLNSDTVEIPSQDELMRYNSIIAFSAPRDITPVSVEGANTEDLLKDENAVKDQVKNNIAADGNKAADKKESEAIKKKKKFKAPAYDQIFEKNCK